jgi:transcription antitermination factor NusG
MPSRKEKGTGCKTSRPVWSFSIECLEQETKQLKHTRSQSHQKRNGGRMTELPRWYALTVKHQHEQFLESLLRSKGFEALAPHYRVRRQWSDRVKQVDLPLFPGYLFCKFEFDERIRVVDTPGVGGVVSFGGRPAPVPDQEISDLQAAVNSRLPIRPWPYLKPGDRVRIERGPLRGVEGTLLREKDGWRIIVGVEMLQRAVAVELEPDMIVPMKAMTARA